MKETNSDPTYDIMAKLDLEERYRENVAFLKIRIGNLKNDGQRNPVYTLVVTHGSGGGILTGGVVNRAEREGYFIDGADCLILGHSHKPFVTQPAKIKIDHKTNTVSVKPFKVLSMTSWMTWGGYAARKMLPPASFAPQIITLCGDHKEIRVEM